MRDLNTIENQIKYGFLEAIEVDASIELLHVWIARFPGWEDWLRVAFAFEMIERYAPEPPPDPAWDAAAQRGLRRGFRQGMAAIEAERAHEEAMRERLAAWRGR